MAQYFEDFSGYTAGDDPTVDGPAGLTERWDTSFGSAEIVSYAGAPSGKAMRISKSAAGRYAISLDAVDSDPDRDDVEVRVLVRVTSALMADGVNWGWAIARGSGTTSGGLSTNETGYAGNAYQGGTFRKLRVTVYDGGSSSLALDTGNTDWPGTVDSAFWLTMKVSGTSLTVGTALEGTPETAIRESTGTDSSISGVGWVGTGVFSDVNVDILAIGVGTNGDAAPTESTDTTAPILTSPTGTAGGATTASGTVSTDEAGGLLDAVVTTSSTTPSAAQIQAGQDHTGSAAVATDLDNAVAGTGSQSVSFTGLTASTTYYVHYVQQDAAGNDATPVSSASFATSAGSTEGIELTLYSGTSTQDSLTGIHVAVWDAANPDATAPDFFTATATTNGSGVLSVDISSIGGIAVSDTVFVLLWKPDASVDEDSLAFAGRLDVVDIA